MMPYEQKVSYRQDARQDSVLFDFVYRWGKPRIKLSWNENDGIDSHTVVCGITDLLSIA